MTRPTLDALKLVRDGHLSAGKPYARPEYPKHERGENGHAYVTLSPTSGTIEYAPKDCACATCRRAA